MIRPSLRKFDQMRPVSMETAINKWAEGSCLIKMGGTHVLCTASVDFNQPTWKRMQNKTGGWVTAEYSMLPRAVGVRKGRESIAKDNRSAEISRLIGRAFRSVVDLERLGKHTITIDCDVIQADGGTRCAAITGGFVALSMAVQWLLRDGELILDLDFEEDCGAEMDANFVIAGNGKFVEIQATGEQHPFSSEQIIKMMELAGAGCKMLIDLQNQILE